MSSEVCKLQTALTEAKIAENLSLAAAIVGAKNLTQDEFIALKGAKRPLTLDEKMSIKRTMFVETFGAENLTEDFVDKNYKRIGARRNLNKISSCETIAVAAKNMRSKHEKLYNRELTRHADFIDTTSGSESDGDYQQDPRKGVQLFLKHQKQQEKKRLKAKIQPLDETIGARIHFNERHLKIAMCCEMLDAAGFRQFGGERVVLNWEKLRKYVEDNETKIRALWQCKRLELKDDSWKQSLIQYVKAKISGLVDINIDRGGGKHDHYTLSLELI